MHRNLAIHELFGEQARLRPTAIAALSGDRRRTYADLDEQSSRLASALSGMGVARGSIAGVCLNRSLDTLVALLGILKAGAAYLPLDPSLPPSRIELMIEDARPSVVVTSVRLAERLPTRNLTIFRLDSEWPTATALPQGAGPLDLAYIMYTSGSSGTPKGVCTPHRAVTRLVCGAQYARLTPREVLLHLSPLSFDASTFEIWGSLLNGGRLALLPEGTPSLEDIGEAIARYGVTTLWLTSALFSEMAARNLAGLCGVRQLLTGGDVVRADVVKRVLKGYPEMTVINGYGPTETTTFACCYPATADTEIGATFPIGRPIPGTTAYVLDEHRQPVAPGTPGEIYIGGTGVANGYLNRPELTAAAFLPDPFSEADGARMYRTGDRGVCRSDGNLEFLGRSDRQIKMRGLRIELDEIESSINGHPEALHSAIAVSQTAGAKQLIAYVAAAPGALDPNAQRDAPLVSARVRQWLQVYESIIYQTLASPCQEPAFNITGWKSSYTGCPLSSGEMREQVNQTVQRVLARAPQRILEIGCGSGMLLFELAPHCRQYVATDFSRAALAYVKRYLPREYSQRVTLLRSSADQLELPAHIGSGFDAVVLNSIVQHFPNIEYLLAVLRKAVERTRDGGCIFLGDLRSLPLLGLFHSAVQSSHAPAGLPLRELEALTAERVREEEELIIHPDFFACTGIDRVASVSVQLKRGRFHNELTRFRYDAILHIGSKAAAPQARCDIVLPANSGWSPPRLEDWLRREQPRTAMLSEVLNARLKCDPAAFDPEAYWALESSSPYRVQIRWSARHDGSYDVLLARQDIDPDCIGARPAGAAPLSWRPYANDPLLPVRRRELARRLREYLKEKLPGYMVPSFVVVMDSLALNANGKADVGALPKPRPAERARSVGAAPLTGAQSRLAELWEQVLGFEGIEAADNFFDIGGDSLRAVQLASRIRETLGMRISPGAIFDRPTLAAMSARLTGADASAWDAGAAASQSRGARRRAAAQAAARMAGN